MIKVYLDHNVFQDLKKPENAERGKLVKQITYITEQLFTSFGPDIEGREKMNSDEIKNQSTLRSWRFGDLIISLILDNELFLNFYPVDYPEAKRQAEKQRSES